MVRISFDIPSSRELKIEPCALELDVCSNPCLVCKLTPHGETTPEFPSARGAGARCEDNLRITASLSLSYGYTVPCLFFSLKRVARGVGSGWGVYHFSTPGFTVNESRLACRRWTKDERLLQGSHYTPTLASYLIYRQRCRLTDSFLLW